MNQEFVSLCFYITLNTILKTNKAENLSKKPLPKIYWFLLEKPGVMYMLKSYVVHSILNELHQQR